MQARNTVSVIGLGAMGSALAAALLSAGFKVAVYNRTRSRCASLGAAGASVMESVPDAVAASEVVVVCVTDYAASDVLLHERAVTSLLAGKTLVQLTTGAPDEAVRAADWAGENGIDYLEGIIAGFPHDIGTANGIILCSGPRAVFDRTRHILETLAPRVQYIADDIGAAAVLDIALIGSYLAGSIASFLHGAAVCESQGIALETYLSVALDQVAPVVLTPALKACIAMSMKGDYRGDQAPVTLWAAGLEHMLTFSRGTGVDAALPDTLLRLVRETVSQGHGDKEIGALFEVLRARRDR